MKKIFAIFMMFVWAWASASSREPSRTNGSLYVPTNHASFITAICYSPDGKYIATGSNDCTIKIWENSTGKQLKTLVGHSNRIVSLDWSQDGKFLASAEQIGSEKLIIWDVSSGKEIKSFLYSHIAKFSPNGEFLLGLGGQAYIWNVKTGSLVKKINSLNSADWSKDGKYILTNDENAIYIYDAISYVKIRTIQIKNTSEVNFSPNGKYIACLDKSNSKSPYGDLKVFDIFTGNELFKWNAKSLYSNPKIVWNPNSASFACGGGLENDSGYGCIYFVNLSNGRVFSKFKLSGDLAFGGIVFSPSGESFAFHYQETTIHILENLSKEIDNKITERTFETENPWITDIVWSKDGRRIVVSGGANDKIGSQIFDSEKGVRLAKSDWEFAWGESCHFPPYHIEYTQSEKNIIEVWSDSIKLIDSEDGKQNRILRSDKFIKSGRIRENFSLNQLNDQIAIPVSNYSGDSSVVIYDLNTNKIIKTINSNDDIHSVKFSADGKYLAAGPSGDLMNQHIHLWEVSTGKEILLQPWMRGGGHRPDTLFSFDPNSKLLCAVYEDINESVYELRFFYTATGEEIFRYAFPGGIRVVAGSACTDVEFSPDGEKIAIGYRYGRVDVLNIITREIENSFYGTSSDNTVLSWSPDGKKLVIAGGYDGILNLWDVEKKELLYSTVFSNTTDYLTYTPEGYFTGTEWATKNLVYFVDGLSVVELDQMYEEFSRPDLIAAKFRGENISETELPTLSEVVSSGSAPFVSFTNTPIISKNRDITVNFSVQDMGGGIGSVYLKLNDKVIQLANSLRKLELVGGTANTTQKSNGKTIQFSHLLTLQNGENTLEAYAMNSAGKIESHHATTKISWKGNTAKPNLYVLAVGVNKYRDRSLWLNYAVPDAISIVDLFKNVKGNLYESVNVTSIVDENVTADGISSAFNSLARKVSADDVFIFYLSGHGTTHIDGDYYFIPVDFRFRNADSIPESAISKHFITGSLSKIKAQKSLVMIDTCNSGAFISTDVRGMAEKTAIDRLTRATGQATIAASSDSQSAMEGYEGHGIFTYVILEGLSGQADSNKDGFISLSELSAYAEEKVPEYSFVKWGYEQYPQIDLRKQSNFPLVGK